jgi:preprotein translocase subunit SecY
VGHPAARAAGWDVFFGVILMGFFVISLVVFVEQSQRRIPVQYAKRMVGRRLVWRHLDLHPAQGQHGRRHPRHLRLAR